MNLSKEEGNDQESIQLNTTPDLGHHNGKVKKTQENMTHYRANGSAIFQ